jgi:hypothetical protein
MNPPEEPPVEAERPVEPETPAAPEPPALAEPPFSVPPAEDPAPPLPPVAVTPPVDAAPVEGTPTEPESPTPATTSRWYEPSQRKAAAAAAAAAVSTPAVDPLISRAYDLPTARGVVAFGLSLAYRASGELRRASIYIGVLTLALLGPPLVFLIEYIAHFQLVNLDALIALATNPEAAASLSAVILIVTLGLLGWIVVTIDGSIIAVALLAAREGDRPFTLREGVIRARQVFWRLVGGGIAAGLVGLVLQLILTAILTSIMGSSTGQDFLVTFIAVILVAPLGYLTSGIVLGDVGVMEALTRSIRLARVRPRIALVVALFTLVTAAIQTFALLAGLDLIVRAGDVLHVGVTGGVGPLVATILLLLLFVMAFGSLTFTVGALVAAPQVAAFLGLTYYSGGLDRVRDQPANARKFRWVTRPMVGLIVVVWLFSGLGIASVQDAEPIALGPGASDAIVKLLHEPASAHGSVAFLFGSPSVTADLVGDAGFGGPAGDILETEYVELIEVPTWLLDEIFDCDDPTVGCPANAGPASAFDDGALLVLEHLAGDSSGLGSGEWGPVLALEDAEQAPSTSPRFPLGGTAIITELRGGALALHRYVFEHGGWFDQPTSARSAFIGADLLTLIPIRLELDAEPWAWDLYAAYAADGRVTSHDTIRPSNGGLQRFDVPPLLQFTQSIGGPLPTD